MKPQLVIDYGARVVTAALITSDGQLVPCSQEIRSIAARHVSSDVLFEPRVCEEREFLWEDALESLSKATARTFFTRARRVGLRRPWDALATADALQLASPLVVLSSAAALVDPIAGPALPRVAMVLVDAVLDPIFAFVAERQLAFDEVEPIVIVSAQTGRSARVLLEKLFRRRGFRRLTILRREIASAMALLDEPPCDCLVVDASDDDVHLYRVSTEAEDNERRFRTIESTTLRGLGWSHWAARIAEALHVPPSASFERALTALLSGSPDAVESTLSHTALRNALDDAWIASHRKPIETDLPMLFAGEIFAIDAVRKIFGAIAEPDAPILEQRVQSVASASRWLREDSSRRLVIAPAASLRMQTYRGEAIELVPHAQLPAPGETSHAEARFRFAGDDGGHPFLMHLLWGTDRAPEGNATLCAVPLALHRQHDDTLHLSVRMRRSVSGRVITGSVEARSQSNLVARARFTEELEVRR